MFWKFHGERLLGPICGCSDLRHTATEPAALLGYVILAHHRPEALSELLEAIYSEEDAYIVSVDGRADPIFAQSLLWLQKFDNIKLVINRGVNWSGVSILDETLAGMQLLLDNCPHIRYIINLSGECYPVKPRGELIAYLVNHPGKSFIGGSPVRDLDDADAAEISILSLANFSPSDPAGNQSVNLLDVPADLFTKGKTRLAGDPAFHLTDFARDARRRLFYINSDRVAEGEVYLAFPSRYFIEARKYFAKKYSGYWHQSAWCVLSREFSEYIFADETSFAVYDHIRNCLNPDETFFATVVNNSPLRDRYVGRSLTYANHKKGIEIDEADVSEINQGEYFFARKFTEKSAAMKQRFRRLVRPTAPENFHGWRAGADAPVCTAIFSHLVAGDRVSWRFGRTFRGEPALGALKLRRDGAIHGYGDPNEWRWRLDPPACKLEFYSAAGEVIAAYSAFALSRNGRVYLFGRNSRDPAVVHYLESEIGEHFQLSASIADGLARLGERGRVRLGGTAAAPLAGAVRDDGEASGFFDDGIASPEVVGNAAAMPLRCVIDGRDRGTISVALNGNQAAAQCWLAPFGIVLTNLFDLEFVVILHGVCGGEGKPVTLFGMARHFTGKLSAVRLRSMPAKSPRPKAERRESCADTSSDEAEFAQALALSAVTDH